MTRSGAIARAVAPSGSTDASASPSNITPGTWKYHHGIPLSAGTTTVSAPQSAATERATGRAEQIALPLGAAHIVALAQSGPILSALAQARHDEALRSAELFATEVMPAFT